MSSTFTAYFRAEVLGEAEALNKMHNLDREIRNLNNRKIQIQTALDLKQADIDKVNSVLKRLEADRMHMIKMGLDTKGIDQQIDGYREAVKRLTSERLEIKGDFDTVVAKLREVKSEADQVKAALDAQWKLHVDLTEGSSAMQAFKKSIDDIISSEDSLEKRTATIDALIKELTATKREIKLEHGDLTEVERKLEILRVARDVLAAEDAKIKLDSIDVEKATEKVEELNEEIEEPKKVEVDTSQAVANVRTLGDVAQDVGGFISAIGSSLESIGGMFGGDLLSQVSSSLIAFGSGVVSQGFSNSVSRFDILKTYPAYMRAVGATDEQIETAYTQLNESVLGLPTRLDEIVDSAKQYSLMLGDIDKGTDLAISLNNALIAGGMSEAMQTQSRHELVRLLMIGDLARKNQWFSMLTGFGASAQYIAKELGFEGKNSIQQLASALSAEVSDEATDEEKAAAKAHAKELKAQFIDALITAGQGEEVLALTEVYKDTMGSALKNLRTAFSNLGSSVLEELDTVLEEETGRDLDDTIVAVSDTIKQRLIPAVRDFVQEHPDFIMNMVDKLTSYDWGTLLSNVGNGLLKYAEVMSTLLSSIPPEVISFFMVGATPIGRALSGLGSFLQMLGGLKLPSFLTSGKGLANAGGQIASFGQSIASVFVGAAGTALTIGNIYLIGQVIKEFANIAADIGAMDFGNFTSNLEQLVPAIGVTATIVTTLSMLFATLHQASGGTFSLAVLAGEGLTAGLVALVGEVGLVIKEMAEAANAVSQAEIPSSGKLKNFANVVNDIMTALIDIDLSDSSKITSRKLDYDNLSSIIDDMVAIGNDLKDLKDLKLTDPEIRTAGSHAVEIVNALGSIVGGIEKAFAGKTEDLTRYDASKTGSAANIITNMKTTMDALSGVATTIKDMMPTLKGLTQDFTNGQAKTLMQHFAEDVPIIIETIGSVYTQIVDLFDNTDENGKAEFGAGDAYGGLGWSEKASNKISTILLNINTALTDLHTIMGTMSDMTSSATQLMNDYTGEGSRMKIFQERLLGDGGFIQSIGEIFTTMKNAFGGEEGSTFDLTHADVGSSAINNIFENIRKAFTSLKVIMEKIPKMLEDLDKLTFSDGYGGTALGNFQYKFEILVDSIASMFQYIHDSPIFAQTDSLDVFTEANNRLEQLAGENGAMARIASIVSYLYDMQSEVSGLIDASKGEEGFTLGTELGSIFAGLKSAFDEISQGTSNVYAMPVMADSLFQAIENIETVILRLRGMSGSVGALANGEDGDVIGTLPTIFAGLKSAFDELGGDSSTIQATADAANNFASALDEVETSAGNAKTGIDNLKTSVSELANMMMVKEGGLSSFGGRLNYVGAMANAAAGQVRSLRDAISSLPTEKTVRVNYVQNGGSVSALKSSVGSLLGRLGHKANGGIIPAYFANGGLGFVPYGTDTVPAMLTPGEYVHRRAAVKAFGEQFMSRINNLDLTGALQALSLRAGSGIIPRQIPTVNNTYNRDNHAKLTQNIYSNNPNYSMKRASRWMRSL